ncbi:hypothetical protein MMC16_001227 [Acarospora aff. strigata]|nr:hypothetical protein [Acarospora aff. strigata]
MPALTLSTEDASLQAQASSPALSRDHEPEGFTSPTRPSYSPISPVFPFASLPYASGSYQQAPSQSYGTAPPSAPSSESDAIALRSAISILQLQRQQSLRDLQALERQKHDAVADPDRFAREVIAGRVTLKDTGMIAGLPTKSKFRTSEEHAVEDGSSDSEDQNTPPRKSSFGEIPVPQNIVRCPPVNWAKYHVVGESLDKLHEEQRLRPSSGEPQNDDSKQAAPHVIAAPYRPFLDKLTDPPMRTRSISRKG